MKIKMCAFIIFLFVQQLIFAQSEYYHTLDLNANWNGMNKAIVSGNDFIMCGSLNDNFFVLNTDDFANPKWAKTFDSLGKEAIDIIADYNGNYVACGAIEQPPIWSTTSSWGVISFNRQGDTLWSMSHPEPGDSYATGITQLIDSSFIVVGNSGEGTGHGVGIIKLSKNGSPILAKTIIIPYDGYDFFGPVYACSDGGFIIARSRFEILKFDASCNLQWVKSYIPNVTTNYFGGFIGPVSKTQDGGFIGTGSYKDTTQGITFGGAALVKLDSNFNVTWARWYGDSIGSYLATGLVVQTPDLGYVACGDIAGGQFGNPDILAFKTDSVGNLIWSKRYGHYQRDHGISVANYQGGYMLFGWGYDSIGSWDPHIEVIKTNGNGETSCNYSGVNLLQGSFTLNITSRTYNDTIITGFSSVQAYINPQQVTLDTLCATINSVTAIESFNNWNIYPNPATNQLFIDTHGSQIVSIKLYSIDGRLMKEIKQPLNKAIDISEFSKGVYLAEATFEGTLSTNRIKWVKM